MSVVQCEICPKLCRIAPGQSGECRIRVNLDGRLLAVTYERPCSVHIDPIEKKPLFHFLPGSRILSLATVGCNLHCRNCQNWSISQKNPEEEPAFEVTIERLVREAKARDCLSIAYTYTDPVVFFEYALDASTGARAAGLRNVLVTAGYMNPGPARRLFEVADAANIDLKFFDDRLYREVCSATLSPVLNALVLAKEMGVWLEVTNLLIPTLSDDPKMIREMCRWIVRNLGIDTPVHFSRFYPHYRLKQLPATPRETVMAACEIAREEGISFIYAGNLPGSDRESTYCPGCGERLIHRIGYSVGEAKIVDGACAGCGSTIAGVWP